MCVRALWRILIQLSEKETFLGTNHKTTDGNNDKTLVIREQFTSSEALRVNIFLNSQTVIMQQLQ